MHIKIKQKNISNIKIGRSVNFPDVFLNLSVSTEQALVYISDIKKLVQDLNFDWLC